MRLHTNQKTTNKQQQRQRTNNNNEWIVSHPSKIWTKLVASLGLNPLGLVQYNYLQSPQKSQNKIHKFHTKKPLVWQGVCSAVTTNFPNFNFSLWMTGVVIPYILVLSTSLPTTLIPSTFLFISKFPMEWSLEK